VASVASRRWLAGGIGILVCFTAVKLLLHLLANVFFPLGYFRDELYYIACGEHLAWGYVDHPPLIAGIALVSRGLLGDSLVALRFFPSVAGAVVVLLTGLMARRLGGSPFAGVLAALAVLAAPIDLVVDNMLSTIPFDHLWWMVCAYLVLVLLQTDNPRYWLAIGAVVGVGLETKDNLWGPGNATGKVVIAIGVPVEQLRPAFASVDQAAIFTCDYCTSEENGLPVYVARDLKMPVRQAWTGLKHYG
jgi:predicted membrane-bound mannosyltransferase